MSLYSASIDDNDPTVIYSSNWEFITSDPPWTGTMHSTSIPGSYARFRFTGSRVAIICTIPTGDGTSHTRATVSIDNGAAIPVSHATTPPVQYQVVLWDSGPLPFASHLVTLTDAGTEAYLRLDRIDYDPTADNAPSKTSDSLPTTTTVLTTTVEQPGSSQVSSSLVPLVSVAPSSSSGASISVQTVYLSPTVSGSSTSLPASDASGLSATSNTPARTIPRAALVGGVLGAVVFILLLGVLLIFLRRRRKKANPQTTFSPFEISAHRQQRGSATVPIPFQTPYSDSASSRASNSIPMTDRKDTELFAGIYDASHTISNPMSPNSLPSAAPFPHSHNRTPTSASTMQSTSLDLSRTDVHTGSRGTTPSGGRATSSSADNRRTVASYLTEAPPPAYGDVL